MQCYPKSNNIELDPYVITNIKRALFKTIHLTSFNLFIPFLFFNFALQLIIKHIKQKYTYYENYGYT